MVVSEQPRRGCPTWISSDPRGRARARSRHDPLGVTFDVSARKSLTLAEALRSIGYLIGVRPKSVDALWVRRLAPRPGLPPRRAAGWWPRTGAHAAAAD